MGHAKLPAPTNPAVAAFRAPASGLRVVQVSRSGDRRDRRITLGPSADAANSPGTAGLWRGCALWPLSEPPFDPGHHRSLTSTSSPTAAQYAPANRIPPANAQSVTGCVNPSLPEAKTAAAAIRPKTHPDSVTADRLSCQPSVIHGGTPQRDGGHALSRGRGGIPRYCHRSARAVCFKSGARARGGLGRAG